MHILHPHIYPNANRPIVSLLSGANGVDNLDPNLTINGTTVTPMFRYKGGDADGTNLDPWTYGEILPITGGTPPTYNTGSPLLGPNDDSTKFNSDGHYKDAGSSTGDITTEDFVFELVFKTGDLASTQALISKYGSGNYWYVQLTSSGTLQLQFDDGSGVSTIAAAGLTAHTWYHSLIFGNRDEASTNGAVTYTNSIAGAGYNISATASTITNAHSLSIGAHSTDIFHYTGNVAYAAAWKYADWMQAGAAGPTEIAAIAKERFLRLTGFWSSKGTVTYTRPTEAVLSKYEGSATKLYTVGDGWPRMDYVVDSASDEIKGYRAETEDENELLYSEEFDDATWVKTRATIDPNNQEAPDGSTTADGLVGTAVSNTHYVGQAIASAAGEHVFAVYAKPGDKDWIYINIPTVANANAYYDIDTGTVGTVGAGATAYIDDQVYNNGYRRCIIIYTGGAPSHSHDIYAADADTDHTFTGDGTTVNTWIWGATHSDEGLGYPTSYIKTEASLVTRVKDNLKITGLGSILSIAKTTKYNVLLQDKPPNAANNYLTAYSNAGVTTDALASYVHVTADLLALFINKGGITKAHLFTGGSDLTDGVIHDIGLKHRDDYQSRIVDGVTISPTDNDSDIMTTRNQLDIGQTWSQGSQLNGVIGQIKIYKK